MVVDSFLGGGFKNISQIGNLPQVGVENEKHLKPPPSFSSSMARKPPPSLLLPPVSV